MAGIPLFLRLVVKTGGPPDCTGFVAACGGRMHAGQGARHCGCHRQNGGACAIV